LAVENLKTHLILALLVFNLSFLLYIYIAKKKVVAKIAKVWDNDWSYFEFKVFSFMMNF
jgi:hypothetical protein